jgi:DNA-binding transcriptional MerR regulator
MEKQIPNKLFFKIGEVCEITDTQPYVLRYWESEFAALAPAKNSSGQRIYRRKDIETVLRIKQLLYEEGFTIAGAKKRLEVELGGRGNTPQAMASLPETEVATVEEGDGDVIEQVKAMREVLLEVRQELRGMLTLLEKGGRKGN